MTIKVIFSDKKIPPSGRRRERSPQLNTIGTLNAQDERPAASGIFAKGAARCTGSTAALSSAALPELRATRMPFDLRITASIGSCTGPLLRETDWKALYRHADRALFEAKDSGRDRARAALPLAA